MYCKSKPEEIVLKFGTFDKVNSTFKLLIGFVFSCEDSTELEAWMRQKVNWLQDASQNEIISDLSDEILRSICSDIRSTKLFSIIVDGTQDISGVEQESVCIRYVDNNLDKYE